MISKYISDDLEILFYESGKEISDKELIDALIILILLLLSSFSALMILNIFLKRILKNSMIF